MSIPLLKRAFSFAPSPIQSRCGIHCPPLMQEMFLGFSENKKEWNKFGRMRLHPNKIILQSVFRLIMNHLTLPPIDWRYFRTNISQDSRSTWVLTFAFYQASRGNLLLQFFKTFSVFQHTNKQLSLLNWLLCGYGKRQRPLTNKGQT